LVIVIKVGGSLAVDSDVLRGLCIELSRVAERFKVVVVPGGGEFADMVREIDVRFGLGSVASHRMALLGMDQFGLLLSELIPNCRVASSLSVIGGLGSSGRAAVFLPSRLLFRARSLVASWNVTSDSVAAYVAGRLGATKLVLVTDVDGVFSADPKVDKGAELLAKVSASGLFEIGSRTSVDRFLPTLLLKFGLDCFVVNGRFPERVAQVLASESAICTHILAK
jgi:aspartokinase-like uncharacterized kinase